jgi:hypothetical protein
LGSRSVSALLSSTREVEVGGAGHDDAARLDLPQCVLESAACGCRDVGLLPGVEHGEQVVGVHLFVVGSTPAICASRAAFVLSRELS